MHNHLFEYLSEYSNFYEKQFGFQTACNTEHAILQLIKQLHQSFDENKLTVCIFH